MAVAINNEAILIKRIFKKLFVGDVLIKKFKKGDTTILLLRPKWVYWLAISAPIIGVTAAFLLRRLF